MILADEMIDVGLMLTASGMGGVFVVLSLLALVMWVMGKIFSHVETETNENFLSEKELMAIVAAVSQYEGIHVPEIKGPENWKKIAKSRW